MKNGKPVLDSHVAMPYLCNKCSIHSSEDEKFWLDWISTLDIAEEFRQYVINAVLDFVKAQRFILREISATAAVESAIRNAKKKEEIKKL